MCSSAIRVPTRGIEPRTLALQVLRSTTELYGLAQSKVVLKGLAVCSKQHFLNHQTHQNAFKTPSPLCPSVRHLFAQLMHSERTFGKLPNAPLVLPGRPQPQPSPARCQTRCTALNRVICRASNRYASTFTTSTNTKLCPR